MASGVNPHGKFNQKRILHKKKLRAHYISASWKKLELVPVSSLPVGYSIFYTPRVFSCQHLLHYSYWGGQNLVRLANSH